MSEYRLDEYRPKLDDWTLCFDDTTDGKKNYEETADTIARFFHNRECAACSISGRVRLNGFLYGADGVAPDSTEHTTGYVQRIERVDVAEMPLGGSCDLFRAVCETSTPGREEKLYFYSRDMGKEKGSPSAYAYLMLMVDYNSTMEHGTWLSKQPGRYIRPELRNKGYY